MLHCHYLVHRIYGQRLLIKVGEESDMPQPPTYFPRCGNWMSGDKSHPGEECKPGINSANIVEVSGLVFMVTFQTLVLIGLAKIYFALYSV